jgi:prepilin-type N-terminal cleavage/methylation domain-containing protein
MKKGFTLVEALVVASILLLLMLAMTSFQKDVFYTNSIQQGSFTVIQDARTILRTMAKELRSASTGGDGSYPIVIAATSTLTFFTDTNNDGVKDKIRYFLATTTLMKGVIVASGTPVTYNPSLEKISYLASNVKNGTSTPLFDYFDGSYNGTSTPLTQPVSVSVIRLVRMTLVLDVDPNRSPLPRTYVSSVTLRNLKDNL